MNSLLQQLYMMPKFRYGVWLSSLQCPITRELREAEAQVRESRGEQPDATMLEKERKAEELGEDDLLHQLQVMFTFLSQSDKQFYDTAPFCFSYKDERGQPINVRVQQDAQEFFNVLLDRLEKRLMALPLPSPFASLSHLIQSSFGGTLVNQLVCHSCHHVRESPEPFYSLSLQVKNKATMTDSLEQYVLGEVLSDFNCFTAGTLISRADGTSIPIEQVRRGMSVLGRRIGDAARGQRDGLVPRTVVSAQQTGVRPCVQLLFDDGRTLQCTADHRILTADGDWVTAAELVVGESEVAVGVEYPRVDRIDDDPGWRLDLTSSLGYVLNTTDRLDAALAFARLLGYACSDRSGGLAGGSLQFAHALDANACRVDIDLVTEAGGAGMPASVNSLEVALPAQLQTALLVVGAKAGRRRSSGEVSELPASVLDTQCPLSLVREFLGGLCGGDGHTLDLCHRPCQPGQKGWTGLGFVVVREGAVAAVQMGKLRSQLLPLFHRVGLPLGCVTTGFVQARPTKSTTSQAPRLSEAELDICRSCALHLDFGGQGVLPFARCVGFRYACRKSTLLSAGTAHFRRIEIQQLSKRANQLEHHAFPLCLPWAMQQKLMEQTLEQMDSQRLFFPPPSRRRRDHARKPSRRRRARRAEQRIPLGAVALDTVDCLPLWRVKLVGRRPAGELPVYDLTVPSEQGDDAAASFVANGVVVHNCSSCQQRVEITKRVCLGSLPSVMIIHLKRFELNYETFQHEKLNGRFVFPLDFNFAPYTKEGLAQKEAEQKRKQHQKAMDADSNKAKAAAPATEEDAEDAESPQDDLHAQTASPDAETVSSDYELVGILIHTGNSSSGHYYSFVKDRCIPSHHFPAPPAAPGAPVWFEFNDNLIRPFDLAFLDEAAYGGEQEVTERTSWGNDVITQQEKVKNAYMLVFERKPKPQPLPSPHPHTNGHSPNPPSNAALPSTAPPPSSLPVSATKEQSWLQPELFLQPPSRVIPPGMLASVQRDNVQFQRDRQIFNSDYFTFLIHILRSYQPVDEMFPSSYHDVAASAADVILDPASGEAQSLRLLKLATIFAFNCLVRCSDNRSFTDYKDQLLRLYTLNVPACQWLLEYTQARGSLITELMLACRDEHVRSGVMELLVLALKKVSVFERDSLGDTVDVQMQQQQQPTQAESKPLTPLLSPVIATTVAASAPTSPQAKKLRLQAQLSALTARYIAAHIHQRAEVPKHWMRFSHYFLLLFEYAKLGTPQRQFLLQRQFVVWLCDLFLGECSPIYDRKGKKRPSIGNMIVSPDWSVVLETLSMLVRACRTESTPRCSSPSSPTCPFSSDSPMSESGQRCHSPYFSGDPHANLALSADDLRMIRTKELYQLALMQSGNIQPMALLACHWCWESASFTEGIVDIVLTGLSKLDHAGNDKSYYQMMCELCGIRDSIRQQRWQRVLLGAKGLLQLLFQSRHTQPKRCFTGVQLLEHLSRNVEGFTQQLLLARAEWTWMDAWLRDYVGRGKKHNFAGEQEREETLWRYEDMLEQMGARVEPQVLHPVVSGSLTAHLPAVVATEGSTRGKSLGSVSGINGASASAAGGEGDPGRARRASWSATGQGPLAGSAFEENGVLTGPTSVLTGTSSVARKSRGLNVSVAAGYLDAKPSLADAAGSRRAKRELNEERDEREDNTAELTVAAKPRRADKRRAKAEDASAIISIATKQTAAAVDHDDSIRHDEEHRVNASSSTSSSSSSSSSASAIHRRAAPLTSFVASPSPVVDADDDIYENDVDEQPSLQEAQQPRDALAMVDDEDEEGDEDDDDLEDEAVTYPADDDSDDPATQLRTRRSSRPQPSSPMRKGLTFEHSPTYEGGRGMGKRRAPSTPVVGGGGGKGKGQPNSPASAGGGGGVGDWGLSEGGAGGQELACTRCTFLNSASARVCEMCEAELV